MSVSFRSACAGLVLAMGITMTASADGLKDEIAPTGKLRVAIAISPAGGAFWSTKTEAGYAGVPVDLGKAMAAQLGVPVEYVAHQNSGQITDAAGKGTWDVTFLPKDPERSRLQPQPASASPMLVPDSTPIDDLPLVLDDGELISFAEITTTSPEGACPA